MIDKRNYDVVLDENEKQLFYKVFSPLYDKLHINDFVNNTVELLNVCLTFNPEKPYLTFGDIRKAPRNYIEKELKWYLSQSRSIKGYMDDVKIWNDVASKDEERTINSNYGWNVFSLENGDGSNSQYDYALHSLLFNQFSRQAVIFYNRPSMHWEWNKNGMHDFTCTFETMFLIRNNKLYLIINQRSCDLITGLFNDWAWHCYVYDKMYTDLLVTYPDLNKGIVFYNICSAHVYERSYDLLKKIVDFCNVNY
jgi:thymidylate synthase